MEDDPSGLFPITHVADAHGALGSKLCPGTALDIMLISGVEQETEDLCLMYNK